MWVHCETCHRQYNDEECWTICPHGPLAFRLADYCPRCDTLASLHGLCRHQRSINRVDRVDRIMAFAGRVCALIWCWRTWMRVWWYRFQIWRIRRRSRLSGKAGRITTVSGIPLCEVETWQIEPNASIDDMGRSIDTGSDQ